MYPVLYGTSGNTNGDISDSSGKSCVILKVFHLGKPAVRLGSYPVVYIYRFRWLGRGSWSGFIKTIKALLLDGLRIILIALIHIHAALDSGNAAGAGVLPHAILAGILALSKILGSPDIIGKLVRIEFAVKPAEGGINAHIIPSLFNLRAESLNYIGQSLPGKRAHRSIVLYVVIDGVFELLALNGIQEELSLLARLSLGNRIAVVVSAYWDSGGFGSLVIVFKLIVHLRRIRRTERGTENGVMDSSSFHLVPIDFPLPGRYVNTDNHFNHPPLSSWLFLSSIASAFSSWSLLASSSETPIAAAAS